MDITYVNIAINISNISSHRNSIKFLGNYVSQAIKKIGMNNLQKFIKTTKLDKTHKPGFKIIYLLPYIFYAIIFILVILLLFFIYKKLKLNRSNNK